MLFLDQIHSHYRRWPVFLLMDEDSCHTSYDVINYACFLNIDFEFLPLRSPHLNPMDHFWRQGKEKISSNHQYESIDEHVERFIGFLDGLSNHEALLKAGILSGNFWLFQ